AACTRCDRAGRAKFLGKIDLSILRGSCMNVRKFSARIGWFPILCGLLLTPRFLLAQCCPPIITTQPTNQAVSLGANSAFIVRVSSATLCTYQWKFNGTNIVGGTSSNLVLMNIQYPNAGAYSVGITNSAGGVVSSSAILTVDGSPQIIAQ